MTGPALPGAAAQLRNLDLPDDRLSASPALTPFLKWPGGKSRELAAIAAAALPLAGRFIDPFVGGGSVLLAVPREIQAWANDASEDLVALYRSAGEERAAFRDAVLGVAGAWDALRTLDELYRALAGEFLTGTSGSAALRGDGHARSLAQALALAGPGLDDVFERGLAESLPSKFDRMRRIELALGRRLSDEDLLDNVEGAVRAAFYMSIRSRYNLARRSAAWDELRQADFLFLREFAYAAMFRFNGRGEFNVPYGGVSYNRKSLTDKVHALFGEGMLGRLRNTTWRCGDFEPFLREAVPGPSDFVFIDPPYDSDFRDYDNRAFGERDQERLQQVLEALAASVMVVVKDTPMIRDLYRSDRWRITSAAKTYMWTIKSRNDRVASHLTITNY
jgi:DNA adenine methylase